MVTSFQIDWSRHGVLGESLFEIRSEKDGGRRWREGFESLPDLPPKECVKERSLNKINFEKEAAHTV